MRLCEVTTESEEAMNGNDNKEGKEVRKLCGTQLVVVSLSARSLKTAFQVTLKARQKICGTI